MSFRIKITEPLLPDTSKLLSLMGDILKSGNITNNGSVHQQFEKALAVSQNSAHCSLVCNATVGLMIALRAVDAKDKVINYVPHGINQNHFFPITHEHELYPKLVEFKKQTIPNQDIEFLAYFNSRNIHRKRPGDVILSFKLFCDSIGEKAAKKVGLILHTEASNPHGTDLRAVKEAIYPEGNIYFSTAKINTPQMNFMYNMADVTMLITSNEGWGLSLTDLMGL